MFNYPATELFRADERRVVWSLEEYDSALAEGWSEDRPAAEEAPAADAPSAEEPPAKAAKAKKQPKTSE